MSKATLYSYFPDKRLLFTEICNSECRRQTDEAEAAMDYTAPVEAQLTFAAERIAGFLMSDFGRNMFRLVVAEGARFPDLARQFYRNGPGLIHDRLVHHMQHMVAQGRAEDRRFRSGRRPVRATVQGAYPRKADLRAGRRRSRPTMW